MFSIKEYTDIIRANDVRSVPYEERVSSNYFHNPLVSKIVESFTKDGKMHITRNDIFNEEDLRTKLIKILVWGYPEDVRNTPVVITHLDKLEKIQHLYEEGSINGKEYLSKLLEIKRLGLSTASKILYFMNVPIGGYPSVIIDARVIAAFPIITELSKLKGAAGAKAYEKANAAIGKLAESLDCKPDQIEYFLFLLGKEWGKHIQDIIIEKEKKADKALIDCLLKTIIKTDE